MRARGIWGDRRGNVGIMAAIAMVPLLAAIGLAVDYGRAANYKSRLQSAADATALAMAHLPPGLSQDEIERRGREFFRAGMPDFQAEGDAWLKVEAGTGRMRVEVDSGIDTVILGVIGRDKVGVAASSEVAWGFTKVEAVLVLDTTLSMAGEKIRQLRAAATSFINILEKVNHDGSVRLGVVPYSTQVRIDADAFRKQAWMDFSLNRDYRRDKPTNAANWQGCLVDRAQPNDVLDDVKSGPKQPAVVCRDAPPSMIALTEDFPTLRRKVSDLTAAGYTNIPLGMVFGMGMLSGKGPFTNAAPPSKDLEKAIILLTDGDNTRTAYVDGKKAIDPRLRLLCTEARSRGYTVYTIRVMNGDAGLLKSCASKKGVASEESYFDVRNAADLIPVFQRIANELSDLRISK